MDKISPCLWFNRNGEEAANFYVSVIPGSRIDQVVRWPMDGEPANAKKGDVLLIDFTLAGRSFQILNGGENFPFTQAISLSLLCKDQAEVDLFWDALSKNGGKEIMCGWLHDKYGLSWQIVPQRLAELIADKDTAKAARAMTAMMKMVKIDVAAIEKAAKG